MVSILVSDEFKEKCPGFAGIAVAAEVENSPYSADLWKEINECIRVYKLQHTMDDIKMHPAIEATRQAYKQFGKDPNRYRPSSESLCRRIMRGMELYQIDTLVDIINLVSIETGYSIGGFDLNKIEGDVLTLGVGQAGEPYEGIGKGMLNIEGLPVYRDALGGVGTPTSDNERTKLDIQTTHLLAIINGYDGQGNLYPAAEFLISLLGKYAGLKNSSGFVF